MCSSRFACVSEGAREMRGYNENESCQKDSEQELGRDNWINKWENDRFVVGFFYFRKAERFV